MYIIGCDIGGTNLKVGLIKNNEIIKKIVEPTDKDNLIEQTITNVNKVIKEHNLTSSDIKGIGVGCPGIVRDGVIVHSNNLKLHNLNLQQILSSRLGISVIVKNDANMAAIAEHKLGSGKKVKNMVLLTLGTGVGGGIIIDGKLYEGNGSAGEIGHMTFEKNGIPCTCGRKGCLEKYVSYKALLELAVKYLNQIPSTIIYNNGHVNINDIMENYEKKDNCAVKIIEDYTDMLTDGVLSICNIFRPDKIIIGGGLSHFPIITTIIKKKCENLNFGYTGSEIVDIDVASLGNNAGILGASVLFD